MLFTTLNDLKKYKPCLSSWKKAIRIAKKQNRDYDDLISFKEIYDSMGYDDLLWSLHVLTPKQQIYLGAKFAETVVHLTDDKRVQECIDTCFAYVNGSASLSKLEAAESAARSAARFAAQSAESAWSARFAAWSAESAAQSAAESAAESAARSAARSAAEKTIVDIIFNEVFD